MNTVFNVGDVVLGHFSGKLYRVIEILPLVTTGGYYRMARVEDGALHTIMFGYEENYTRVEIIPVCAKDANGCEKCGTEMSDHYSYGLGETIKKCQKCGWTK